MITPKTIPGPQDVGMHYDELDYFYRRLWGDHLHHGYWRKGDERPQEAVVELLKLVSRDLSAQAGHRISDVGCGYGATARYFAEGFGCHVIGYTVSESQYLYARSRAVTNGSCRYVLGDWMTQPAAPGASDGLLAIESSEHFLDKSGFFKKAYAELRPGGWIAVCAWLAAPRPRDWEVSHLLSPICAEGRLPGLGNHDEYVTWLTGAGFEQIRSLDISSKVRKTWSLVIGSVAKELVSPGFWRFLLDGSRQNRDFLIGVLRIALAYRTGSLRYEVITARRPTG